MKFNYNKCDIPSLSWLIKLEKGSNAIEVYCGKAVECREKFFVAGVWAGDFASGEMSSSLYSACSGVQIAGVGGGNQLIINGFSDCQTFLFGIKEEGTLCFSNSAAFILAFTGNKLDVNYYHYEEDFCSGLFGIEKQVTRTPLDEGRELLFFRYCNIIVQQDLNYQTEKKKSVRFEDFTEYRNKIDDILRTLIANAQDEGRESKYGMISTISKGYDATATSALVRKIGCDEVITLNRPSTYASDCGTDIAKVIGFEKIYEEDGNRYKQNVDLIEAESCCTGDMGSEMIFLAYDNLTANKIVFMGGRGDSVWERTHTNVNDTLDFTAGNQLAQSNLTPYEHYNRINSIVINVPLIGAEAWPDLAKISNSEEMKPWSVREYYDRPISRRLVEEMGVDRESFGQSKKGAGLTYHFNTLPSLKYKMSPTSYLSLMNYAKRIHRNQIKRLYNDLKFYSSEISTYTNYLADKAHLKFRLKSRSRNGYTSSSVNALLILWSMNEMIKRYDNIAI